MNKSAFELAIAEIIQIPAQDGHPFLTVAKFIFTDDKPNSNNQAIAADEFDAIAASSVGMPVKMRFDGTGATKHPGSIPIGVIRSMIKNTTADGTNQLIAEAVLWADEYPEEVAYLKEAFSEGKAPGISWELGYKSTILENGINWLKKVVTRAATFVGAPAYGARTALLALASLDEDDMRASIIALAEELQPKVEKPKETIKKGGTQVMTEEEIKKLQDDLKKAQAETETLKAAKLDDEKIIKAKDEEIAKITKDALVESRIRKYSEAGLKLDPDVAKADKKKEMFAALTEEQFEEYLTDLREAGKVVKATPEQRAQAAASSQAFPKPNPTDVDTIDLKEFMKGLGRPE